MNVSWFFFEIYIIHILQNSLLEDFPGGPMIKSMPCSVGDVGLIPGWVNKIPCAVEQLSPCVTPTRALEPV